MANFVHTKHPRPISTIIADYFALDAEFPRVQTQEAEIAWNTQMDNLETEISAAIPRSALCYWACDLLVRVYPERPIALKIAALLDQQNDDLIGVA